MKLTDHLYFYRGVEILPVFGLTSGNSCIIKGNTLTLTDPGTAPGFQTRNVKRCMRTDGLAPEAITQIFITHAHQDHSPAAAHFYHNKNAKVLCHEKEIPFLQSPSTFYKDEIRAFGYASIFEPPEFIVDASVYLLFGDTPSIQTPTAVRDGDIIDESAGARVIALPGHRPGEIGIYLEKDSAIVTGDIINWRRYEIPSLNMPLSDLDQTVESLIKIKSLSIDVMTNGHEKFVRGQDRIRKWIDDVIGWCEWAKETTRKVVSERNNRVSLVKLGLDLTNGNKDIPPYEIIFIAHTVLKSIGYSGKVFL